MTSINMGRLYIEEAEGRGEFVRLALERRRWATVVREAQESVELFLKGMLRLVALEPAHTRDVAMMLRREAARLPQWLQPDVERLAAISESMARDRGPAFYGDEKRGLGPQELFHEEDAARAMSDLDFVAAIATRLLAEHERANHNTSADSPGGSS